MGYPCPLLHPSRHPAGPDQAYRPRALRDRKFADSLLERSGFEPSVPQARDGSAPDSTSRRLRAILDMMQRLDLTDNERAILITALRRLVDFDPQTLSPQTQALKAILERLEPQKPQPIPDTASTG